MSVHTIVWRRLDLPGYESARLSFDQLHDRHVWCLRGSAIFIHGGLPCQLSYSLSCDVTWKTHWGHVQGWLGNHSIEANVGSHEGSWRCNGAASPQVEGCIDLDLNFSPSTNLLPIRRLNLAVGERADVTAAWLRFPSFELEPLQQTYHRLSETTYRYESAGGKFTADIEVNEVGLVTRYGDYWQAEAIG